MKQDNQSYEDRNKKTEGNIFSNIKKHENCLNIDYTELENFDFFYQMMKKKIMLDSMKNPELLDLDFEGSDSVSKAPFKLSTTIDNLLLPNEQFN